MILGDVSLTNQRLILGVFLFSLGDRPQVWKYWEDPVHQAGRDSLLLWGALLLLQRSLPDGSEPGLLYIQRQRRIGLNQICLKDVRFEGLRSRIEAPN